MDSLWPDFQEEFLTQLKSLFRVPSDGLQLRCDRPLQPHEAARIAESVASFEQRIRHILFADRTPHLPGLHPHPNHVFNQQHSGHPSSGAHPEPIHAKDDPLAEAPPHKDPADKEPPRLQRHIRSDPDPDLDKLPDEQALDKDQHILNQGDDIQDDPFAADQGPHLHLDDRLVDAPAEEDPMILSDDGLIGRLDEDPPADAVDSECQEIRQKLLSMGLNNVGPITSSTRAVYLKLLQKVAKKGSSVNYMAMYPCELNVWMSRFQDMRRKYGQRMTQLDEEMSSFFCRVTESLQTLATPVKRQLLALNRTRTLHKFYNYLLLDLRLLKGPLDLNQEGFNAFIRSIFYVGKGTGSRFRHHFQQARKPRSPNDGHKIGRLRELNETQDVRPLVLFPASLQLEALNREAAMICALGLGNLTNEKGGEFHEPLVQWPHKKRALFGITLLFRAYQMLLRT